MGNPRKGGQFERRISKELSLWWSEGERDDLVWRTSQSGGRATQRAKTGRKTAGHHGDLTWTHPSIIPFFNLFLVELKCGYTKDIDPLKFIDATGRKNFLLEVFTKAEKERKRAGRFFTLIIFQRNRHNSCIMFKTDVLMKYFNEFSGLRSLELIQDMYIEVYKQNLVIIPLENFFKWISPKTIELILEDELTG